MRRLPTLTTAVASALLFAAPAFADSHMAGEGAHDGMKNQVSLRQQCEILNQRYQDTQPDTGEDANVLESVVLHHEGKQACDDGNFRRGIGKLQEALRAIGASTRVPDDT